MDAISPTLKQIPVATAGAIQALQQHIIELVRKKGEWPADHENLSTDLEKRLQELKGLVEPLELPDSRIPYQFWMVTGDNAPPSITAFMLSSDSQPFAAQNLIYHDHWIDENRLAKLAAINGRSYSPFILSGQDDEELTGYWACFPEWEDNGTIVLNLNGCDRALALARQINATDEADTEELQRLRRGLELLVDAIGYENFADLPNDEADALNQALQLDNGYNADEPDSDAEPEQVDQASQGNSDEVAESDGINLEATDTQGVANWRKHKMIERSTRWSFPTRWILLIVVASGAAFALGRLTARRF